MSDPLVVSLVVVYFAISFLVGILGRRLVKQPEHYFAAHRLFGPVIIGIASFAAIMSGFGFVGGPGLVYSRGAISLWITLSQSVAFGFSWWIIGKRLRALAEVRKFATLPEIAGDRFKSNAVRCLLALCLILGVIAYLGTQVMAGGYVVSGLLGVSLELGIAIIFGITMVYTVVAGMVASILTDVFQGAVMLIAAIAVLVLALVVTGGTEGLFTPIAQKDPTLIDPLGVGTWMLALMWYFIFAIGNLGQPHLATKFLAVRSYKDLKWGGVISGGSYMVSSLLWIFVGYTALWFVVIGKLSPLAKPDEAATAFLSQIPSWVSGIVYAGLLAAIMSTASGFISIGTAAIVRDIPKALKREIAYEKQIFWGRVVTVLLTLFAVLFGYFGGYLVALLGALGWGYFASALVPILGIGLNWKRATREAAIASLSIALGLNIVFLILEQILKFRMPYGMPSYVIVLLLSLLAIIFVSFVTKSSSEDEIDPDIRAAMEL